MICRSQHAMCGCKTCVVRLCGPGSDQGFACINKHLSGVKALFTPRKGVVFRYTEWECMPVSCCGVLVCLGSEGTRGEGLQNVFQHTDCWCCVLFRYTGIGREKG